MLLFLLLTVIPMVSAIGLSFTNFNMLEAPRFVGWQNYQRMLLGGSDLLQGGGQHPGLRLLTGPISYVLSFLSPGSSTRPAGPAHIPDCGLLYAGPGREYLFRLGVSPVQ